MKEVMRARVRPRLQSGAEEQRLHMATGRVVGAAHCIVPEPGLGAQPGCLECVLTFFQLEREVRPPVLVGHKAIPSLSMSAARRSSRAFRSCHSAEDIARGDTSTARSR